MPKDTAALRRDKYRKTAIQKMTATGWTLNDKGAVQHSGSPKPTNRDEVRDELIGLPDTPKDKKLSRNELEAIGFFWLDMLPKAKLICTAALAEALLKTPAGIR